MARKSVAAPIEGDSGDDVFVLQCGDRSICLRIEDPKDDRGHYQEFVLNVTRAAAILTRYSRCAFEGGGAASPQAERGLAGIECLTELAAEIVARFEP